MERCPINYGDSGVNSSLGAIMAIKGIKTGQSNIQTKIRSFPLCNGKLYLISTSKAQSERQYTHCGNDKYIHETCFKLLGI